MRGEGADAERMGPTLTQREEGSHTLDTPARSLKKALSEPRTLKEQVSSGADLGSSRQGSARGTRDRSALGSREGSARGFHKSSSRLLEAAASSWETASSITPYSSSAAPVP